MLMSIRFIFFLNMGNVSQLNDSLTNLYASVPASACTPLSINMSCLHLKVGSSVHEADSMRRLKIEQAAWHPPRQVGSEL